MSQPSNRDDEIIRGLRAIMERFSRENAMLRAENERLRALLATARRVERERCIEIMRKIKIIFE